MRSYRLEKLGHVDGIVRHEEAQPRPRPTEILLRVRAASLNRRDVLILSGRYPLPSRPGVIPLSDGAGEVVAVGGAVSRFAVGDRVTGSYWPRWLAGRLRPEFRDQLGCTSDGLLTEYALLDEQAAVRVPEHLTWPEASGLSCAGVTAWKSLTGGQPLRPGQTVLTLGSGDVSLFAIQFARLLGCRVIATTSSDAKADRLRAMGADHIINYEQTPDWAQEVHRLTAGAGADLVVETQGPATIEQSIRSCGLYGQIVLLWVVGDEPTSLQISDVAYARTMATIRREFVGSRADLEAMNQAIGFHRLRPVIDRVFGFDEAPDAYRYFLTGASFGKVVIISPAG
jgi:NADPH:quinone reductase-like Zn-dependent oxidoreductase